MEHNFSNQIKKNTLNKERERKKDFLLFVFQKYTLVFCIIHTHLPKHTVIS